MTSVLQEARERVGVKIEDVAKQLKIRRQYLVALEENDYGKIPGDVYAQGYLKMYASYLGINLEKSGALSGRGSLEELCEQEILKGSYCKKKIATSLFLIAILCMLCWYSITDKILHDDNLVNKVYEYSPEENVFKFLQVHHEEISSYTESDK